MHAVSWDQAQVCQRAGAWMSCLLRAQPYLLLHVIDLRAQPLHHAVQLRDLHLSGAEVIAMAASRPLELLILGAGESRGRGHQARGEMAVASQGPTGFQCAAWWHLPLPSPSALCFWLCPSLSMSADSTPQLPLPACAWSFTVCPSYQGSYPQKLSSLQACLSLSDF